MFSALLASGAALIPVVDNYELTQTPMEYLLEGNFNKVPSILGTNANEMSAWLCPVYSNLTASNYEKIIYGNQKSLCITMIFTKK